MKSLPEQVTIHSEQEMLAFGQAFASELKTTGQLGTTIELVGDVGAGKTTFVRGLAQGLGIKKPVTSPSFTISKSYAFPGDHTLTHYDFYRLADPGLMAEDLHEAIKNHHLVVVEWADSVTDLLPAQHIIISVTLDDEGFRRVAISPKGQEQISSRHAPSHPFIFGHSHPNGETQKVSEKPISSLAKLYLDTSTPNTILKINDKEYSHVFDNTLSKNLLQFIHEKLIENNYDWHDIGQITFMSGPGSFTGLRIGAAVVNTLAHELNIPLYDHHGTRHQIILPDYGRAANISQPKK